MSESKTETAEAPIKKRELSQAALAEFEALVPRYAKREATLLPLLRIIEREFGCIDHGGMLTAAELVGVSPAKVLGVVTFYTHYKRETDGKHVVEICRTLPCALRGADKLAAHAQDKLGIKFGETTEDGRITLKAVECLAACGYGPCMQIDGRYHENLTLKSFDEIVEKLQG